jgi:hypothetical protein
MLMYWGRSWYPTILEALQKGIVDYLGKSSREKLLNCLAWLRILKVGAAYSIHDRIAKVATLQPLLQKAVSLTSVSNAQRNAQRNVTYYTTPHETVTTNF